MAHFARVVDGVVVQTIVVNNGDCGGGEFPDSEAVGQAFIASLGFEGTWLQTSYSGSFRGLYGQPGMIYDSVADEFLTLEVPNA